MGKRRTFTPDFKLEAVLDMVRGEKTIAQICRERDIPNAHVLITLVDKLSRRDP